MEEQRVVAVVLEEERPQQQWQVVVVAVVAAVVVLVAWGAVVVAVVGARQGFQEDGHCRERPVAAAAVLPSWACQLMLLGVGVALSVAVGAVLEVGARAVVHRCHVGAVVAAVLPLLLLALGLAKTPIAPPGHHL